MSVPTLPMDARDVIAVEAHGVRKRFGDKTVLDDVSLRIGSGRFVVLLGPSGSGKTTLLRCIAGIERIDDGLVVIAGDVAADGRRHAPPERRGLAMVFQDYALWPHMTVTQNVAYAVRRRGWPPAEVRRRVGEMLDRVGLGALAGRYPNELSGGEQQRVALARALVGDPLLLLFDEPLSNLDANLREQMRVEIGTLVREAGASALYITHDQGEAFALGDEVGVLSTGRLVQFGDAEAVYSSPANAFVARFTGTAGELRGTAVRELGPGLLAVRVGAVDVPARGDGSVLPRDPVCVFVRASAARLVSPMDEAASLRGVVADVAFRGHGYDHVIDLEGGGRLVGVYSDRRRARDEATGIALAPAGCHAFPDDGVAGGGRGPAGTRAGPAGSDDARAPLSLVKGTSE